MRQSPGSGGTNRLLLISVAKICLQEESRITGPLGNTQEAKTNASDAVTNEVVEVIEFQPGSITPVVESQSRFFVAVSPEAGGVVGMARDDEGWLARAIAVIGTLQRGVEGALASVALGCSGLSVKSA